MSDKLENNNKYQYIEFGCDLTFQRLKTQDKKDLYTRYKLIIRRPKALPNNWVDDLQILYEKCQLMSKKKKQIIFCGILLTLSTKMYLLVYLLCKWQSIDEMDFSYFCFRNNKTTHDKNKKYDGNLRKSISKLKKYLIEQIKKCGETGNNYFVKDKNFNNELFEKEFYALCHVNKKSYHYYCTEYTKSTK